MPTFSPSVNLTRDADRELQYIPTANARRIYHQLLADYAVGIRAFSVIGSYGTGKSAFLLALEKTLSGEAEFFPSPNGHFGAMRGIEFVNIVGSFTSFAGVLGQRFDVAADGDSVLSGLGDASERAKERGLGLAIVVDEFGKFLEYASHSNPEEELYFIQRLAEFVNDPTHNILLITVLHQNFSTYGSGLSREQKEEWEKVKGRLKELTFNEPVEQLLELAATFRKNGVPSALQPDVAALVDAIDMSAAFPHRGQLSLEFAEHLLPIDILAASVLTQALQRYGQNERSLFTFLYANDYLGINEYDAEEHPYYNLVCVYDYLAHNFNSLINSVHNPHFAQWGVIRRTQERAEAVLPENVIPAAVKFLKVIGLLSIFAPDGAKINAGFLQDYGQYALGIDNPTDGLNALESHKLIRYVRFKDSFVLFEGTDLNIEFALAEAEGKVDPIGSISPYLQEHFAFPMVLAKASTLRTGTPRFFQFQISESPLQQQPEEVIDGFINLVFPTEPNIEDQYKEIAARQPATLYALYRDASDVRQTLLEVEKINAVLEANRDDRAAVRELQRLRLEYIGELNQQVLSTLYDSKSVQWIWKGTQFEVTDPRSLNRLLSQICEEVYCAAPRFHNELVNRHKVSAAVSTARRYLFRSLVDNWQSPDLGFPAHRFPAEKSIYLTLLRQTGIHRQDGEYFVLDTPEDDSFKPLWGVCVDFLESAKTTPRNLSQLKNQLSSPPYKLKEGFLDFWMPIFVFAKREEFALYYDGTLIPEVKAETLDLILKESQKFRIKSFSVDGVRLRFFNRFREFVQLDPSEQLSNTGFIETIRPFLTFYRSLSAYAQQTTKIGPEAIQFREVIAKTTDPEKAFFEDFPAALGFDELVGESATDESIEAFVESLQQAIRELRSCYDELVNRIELSLLDILGLSGAQFPDYRDDIRERFATLQPAELLPRQRTLLMRLTSALDDRDAWLNSVVQVVLGRDIRSMRDEDEGVVHSKLRTALQELDNLCQIGKLNADLERELPPIALEITTAQAGSHKHLHRLPLQKEAAVSDLESKVRAILTDDESVNAGALIRILQDLMANE